MNEDTLKNSNEAINCILVLLQHEKLGKLINYKILLSYNIFRAVICVILKGFWNDIYNQMALSKTFGNAQNISPEYF